MRRFLLLALSCACASSPTLRAVPLGAAAAPSQVAGPAGSAITLTEARVTLADLRVEHPPDPVAGWRSWSLMPEAHAHPGHDFAGGVGGELLGTFEVDLLQGADRLGDVAVYDGAYATARFSLVSATLAGMLDRGAGAEPVPFRFELTGAPYEVTGVAADWLVPGDTAAGLRLTVDLAHALSFLDAATPPDPSRGPPLTLDDGDLGATVPFGLHSATTWLLDPAMPGVTP